MDLNQLKSIGIMGLERTDRPRAACVLSGSLHEATMMKAE